MKRKIVFLTIATLLFSLQLPGIYSSAQEDTSEGLLSVQPVITGTEISEPQILEKEELHVVFAVDHSGSMNQYQQEILLENVLLSFLDTMADRPVAIGYVAYNDRILANKPPVLLQSPGQAEELKELIKSPGYHGETDIGLGLKEAYGLLDSYSGPGMIVLISDGNTDLANSHTGRTEQDSERDIQEVITGCQTRNIPIVTIALGQDSDAVGLSELSKQTFGSSYSVAVPAELTDILLPMFYRNPGDEVYEIGTGVYQTGNQIIKYEGSTPFDQSTLLLLSDQELKNVTISVASEGSEGSEADDSAIPVVPAGNYAIAKLSDRNSGFTVSIETKENQTIAAYVIGEQFMSPVMEWQDALYKNRPLDFTIYFEDIALQRVNIAETDLFAHTADRWDATLIDNSDGSTREVELIRSDEGLTGSIVFDRSGSYDLCLTDLADGNHTGNIYFARGIQVINTLPDSIHSGLLELITIDDQQTVDLNQYFKDADQDVLTYEIQDYPAGVISASIDGSILNLTPVNRGTGEIALMISDGEGQLSGRIPVRVFNILEAYWPAWLFIIVVLILFLFIKFYSSKQNADKVVIPIEDKKDCWFTGKLNAYFTRLPEGVEEVPPLTFALHHLREKKIVLGNMFKNQPDLADLLELENIVLLPAENRKFIFYHNTNATIMLGNSIVCKKMQYLVSYGNIIYITSKDGTCELEIHYISMI